jgi:hypothetical protein
MRRAGIVRDATYLVRPDGYIALAESSASTGPALAAYLASRHLR